MIELYFERYVSSADAKLLASIFIREHFKAKTYFAEQQKPCNYIGFIERGFARSYFIDLKGNENTVCFSSDGMMLVDPISLFSNENARFSIQILEDSTIQVTTKEELAHLYEREPRLNLFGRKVVEASYVATLNRIMDYQTTTAEERYLDLMKHPELFQKIPLKYLASYIGITDSSLSRIRKNISL